MRFSFWVLLLIFSGPGTSDADIANAPVEKYMRNSETRAVQKTKFVPVHRSESVEAQRSKLPIYSEEQSIMEAINDNYVCYTFKCH